MDASPSTLTNDGSNLSIRHDESGRQANDNEFSWQITRQPGSTITFASFDPETATTPAAGDTANSHAFRKLSLNEELCRPKRIVIETAPNGRSTWRFVPNARREEGVESEGVWPRVVDVCGKWMTLTHEQWDKFKLDRRYDCLVRAPPDLTVISTWETPREPIRELHTGLKPPTSLATSSLEDGNNRVKRRLSDDVYESLRSNSYFEVNKKRRARIDRYLSSATSDTSDEEDEAEEDEVDLMIIDDQGPPKRHLQSERLKKVRAMYEEARRKRREYFEKRKARQGGAALEGDYDIPWSNVSHVDTTGAGSEPSAKRKVAFRTSDNLSDISSESEVELDVRSTMYLKQGEAKRIRTMSPDAVKRAVDAKRVRRENKRREELDKRTWTRAQVVEETIMKQLYEEGAQLHTEATNPSSPGTAEPSSTPVNENLGEEARHQAMIEESRRKIAELERDRPLWEEAARHRAAQETEEQAQAQQAEAKRRVRQARVDNNDNDNEHNEQQRAAARHAEEHARREHERVAAELRAKRAATRQAAQRDARQWVATLRLWTHASALERYMQLSEAFDRMNFAGDKDVVVFETVPWPVLKRPGAFAVEDIDWDAVESFFRQVRRHLSRSEYVALVEKSHRRFHPDRWRSRRVLQSVEDEEERECLEVAANTVAQALTPLWQEVKGR